MYRFFYILINFIILSTISYAIPSINIDSENINITNFELEYFVDNTEKMTFEDVINQTFIKTDSKVSLGKNRVHTWLRFKIINTTEGKKTLYIHDEIAYISKIITFIESKNNKVLNRLDIDFIHKENMKYMYGTDAIFLCELESNQSKTVYIKKRSDDYQFFNISIYDNKNSKHALRTKHSFPLLVLGMLIALMFYHFILYLSTRYKAYIYYSLYLASAVIWELQLTGILANMFNLYYDTINDYLFLSVFLIPIFLVLFAKRIFDTKHAYKTEDLFLNSILVLFMVGFLIGLYSVEFALLIASYMYMYMFVILFLTTISIYRKGNPLALFFLIGNSFFLFFTFINDLFFLGLVPYNDLTFNAAHIGILIESMVLAFIISYQIKLLQKSEIEKTKVLAKQTELKKLNDILEQKVDEAVKEVELKQKLLQQQSRLAQMGEMLSMIAHQWRQPLGAVSAVVIGIQSKMKLRKFDLEKEKDREQFGVYLNDKLLSLQEYVTVMTETVDDFRNFFKHESRTKLMNVNEVIEKALHIVHASLEANNIHFIKKMESKQTVPLYQNEVMQVILNILQNADDAFAEHAILHKEITIHTYDTDTEVIIKICDNAGGIPSEIIEKIFDPYFSTKFDKNGTGLGLYMSKMIIEDHHKGRLKVINYDKGACFMLIFISNKEVL